MNFKVSIIVVTYNPVWNKLYVTLNSILLQNFKDYEIIVADDGSDISFEDEIVTLFENNKFTNYKLINSTTNMGTVCNITNALNHSQGQYIKTISPGDLFYNEHSLSGWIKYIELHNSKICFCNSVYYRMQDKKIEILKEKTSPANLAIYKQKNNRKQLFVNYLLANDSILGAAFMMEHSTMSYYLNMINGKVRYAEDYMVRLMVFDGIKIDYIQHPFIWYEYGEGISTNKENVWSKRLFKDFQVTNQIIKTSCICQDNISKKYRSFLEMDIQNTYLRKVIKCLMFPSVIYWRRKAKKCENYTYCDVEPQLAERMFPNI